LVAVLGVDEMRQRDDVKLFGYDAVVVDAARGQLVSTSRRRTYKAVVIM
jgi:hypothetical protein